MNTLVWLATVAQTSAPTGDYRLTPGGWVVMLLSVGFVTGLLGWCIWRVFSESSAKKLQAPLDVDTRDREENGSM